MTQNIYGNDSVRALLKRRIETQKLSHAYLFHGLEGVGKKRIAMDFIEKILGMGSQLTAEHIHKKCTEGNHPDYFVMGDEEGSIKIESVETMQMFLRTKPIESQYKVVLIDDAHNLTQQAQNRLLKTLEEPPAYAMILLISHRTGDLLETLLSRVESLSFGPLGTQAIEDILKEKAYQGSVPTYVVASIAEGSALRALRISEDPLYMDMRNFIIDWISDIINGSAINAQRRLDQQEIDKEKAGLALQFLKVTLRDLLVFSEGAHELGILKDVSTQLIALSQKIQPMKVMTMLDAAEKAQKSLDSLVQPLLVMDVLFHTLQEVYRG